MCSYREPLPNELSFSEIEQLARQLKRFGLRYIVFSGGEPLLRKDFSNICETFSQLNVKQTLLTNGLLMEKRFDEIGKYFSEIIISLDGPNAETHNAIRGLVAFDQIVKGIKKVTSSNNHPQLSIRFVIQKKNFRLISEMIEFTKSLGVNRISFLPVDIISDSFGRYNKEVIVKNEKLMLNYEESIEFRKIITEIISQHQHDFEMKFISDSPQSLLNRVQYFEALLGKNSFPKNYCNAPNVSAVITSTGEMQPCFFLPQFANVRKNSLAESLNNSQIRSTRKKVQNLKLERCKTCVCTLDVQPFSALFDKF
jgi:MoaA/NifB/PqqE/SkfB family radical SAM enzyme